MEDDDVICLSSDDEVAHDETPRKKAKINYAPLTAKIEPKDNKRDTILCSLKRKSPDNNGKSISNMMKKKKVDETVVEEIIIESPSKDEVTRPSTTIRDDINVLSVEVLRDKLENGTISINKVTIKKPTELSKAINQPKSSNFKAKNAPVRNDVQKLLTNSNLRESNGKNATSLKLHPSKSTFENPDRLLNPVSKLKEGAIYKSSSSQMLLSNHHLSDGTDQTNAMGASETTELAKSHIKKPKSLLPSPHLMDEELTSSASPVNIVNTVENPKAAENKIDEHLDKSMNSHEKSGNSSTSCPSSISSEVLILPRTETPNVLSVANSQRKTLPNTENSTNSSAQSAENSHLPCVTNSEIFNDGRENIFTKTTDSDKGIALAKNSPSVSTSKLRDTPKPAMKSEANVFTIQMMNNEPGIKRIKPQRLTETMSNSNQSIPDTEKTSEFVENSATHNSKESDTNIANGHEKSMLSDPKNSKVKKDHSSNNAVPKSGFLTTPDEGQLSSMRRTSTSPDIEEKCKNKSDDGPKFEPQPGCSKSPDAKIDGKPRLVVFDKKPVSLQTEDTFSMFLSLCLQTDRSLDMEKVVAKLKRYYEQLNPAYAASEAFRDTLNEKRDLIMRKGKKVVYHYVQLLKEDMKAKKKIDIPLAKVKRDEGAAEREDEVADAGQEEDDTEEARRVKHKIKRIEKAMKECQKMIKKYEEAEIDFDDDNNSNYIKLDRFKERMVQLYTQMCKYTHEHPDAGRAYLRPKHLRVTQIPSVDQAINSFINSKLAVNKYKVAKGKSFVDGLIFPDYVDILECVEKVNKEQDLKLGKRSMQNLAEKAFTQMGKHLQEARQNDYWDTFSLNLDNTVDPATSDPDLLEKLARNKTVAEENEKKVFEEFVRRQEEGKIDDKDDSPSEIEDEDDAEDEEQGDEEPDDEKKSKGDVESDEQMSIGEDTDRESVKENDEDSPEALETISIAPDAEVEDCAVEDIIEHISKNNNLEPSDSTDKDARSFPVSSPKDSAGKETMMIEVILDDVEAEDSEIEPQEEEKLQQPLRIRSFAKPPDSWQCSQEGNQEKNEDNTTKPETLEDTEQEISVVSVLPGREKSVENLTNNSKTIVGVPLNNITKNITAYLTTKSKFPTNRSMNAPNTSTNTTNGKNLRYVTIGPGVKRPVQLPPSRVQKNVQTTQIIGGSGAPEVLAVNSRQVKLGTTATTSTPVQRTQLQIKTPRVALQQTNQVQVLRLSNGKCVSATIGSRPPNTPRFLTVAASSTAIRPVQLSSGAISTYSQFRPIQIRPGVNTGFIRSQVPSPARNSTNFSKGVSVTSTPFQRLNNHQQNKVKVTANFSVAQSSQMPVLRVNNGKYVMSSSSENSRIPQQVEQNASQQQQKLSNVAASVKGVNSAGSSTLPVLKPRMNDNVRTVQQQKSNVTRSPRPGDQNRQTSEGGPKRKNELL